MSEIIKISSYLQDQWQYGAGQTALIDPVTNETIAQIGGEGLDFASAVAHARTAGRQSLAEMNFAERAALLRKMADILQARRDEFVDLARRNSGNTPGDIAFDIDGGIATLKYYSGLGKGLGEARRFAEPDIQLLDKEGHFTARHVLSPVPGVAVHINAFNFPSWGLWEKVAPAILAGVPCISKPASATAAVSFAMVRALTDAGVIPPGVLTLICASARDLLDCLGAGDVIAFTGSADTANLLRAHPAVAVGGVRFNTEADSLNAAVLGLDVAPGSDTYGLFLREVVREMTVKAGQKCTAIRRILVPEAMLDSVAEDLSAQLSRVSVGDPAVEGVRMGPLVNVGQRRAAAEGLALLRAECDLVCGGDTPAALVGNSTRPDCFLAPTLLWCRDPESAVHVHEKEVFGPVATLMPYRDNAQAGRLVGRGKGSLVSSVFTDEASHASALLDAAAPWHGRLLFIDAALGKQQPGHGVVMPQCTHGGPGRAGGGQELGGLRGLELYLQRTAVQGHADRVQQLTRDAAVWPGA
ncbi:3,4-dehydroadipyl-CoA semialdehyde dehydrogenase [Marinobacter sp.]|uniref:3,4-dehydroadipyl-CoA semialdehyde dehydrogenase n=1 Tax=Marinobacter sp. TaxID=50741 RepID=UPI0038506812